MKGLLTGILLAGLFALPFFASANISAQTLDPYANICDDKTSDAAVCNADGNDDPLAGEDGVILRAVGILAYVVGAAAVIMIIIGGLKFITANGDPNSISSARNTIIYTLIGVAVFAISNLIVRFVISRV